MDFLDKKLLLIMPFSDYPQVSKELYKIYYKDYQNYGGKPVDEDWAMTLYDLPPETMYMAKLGKAIGMAGECDGIAICNNVVDDRFTRDMVMVAEAAGFAVFKL